MSLDDMLADGHLRRDATSSDEISKLLEAMQRRLDDAGIELLHPESRIEQAYEAMHLCAKAALRAKGFRIRLVCGAHEKLIATLADTIYETEDDAGMIAYFNFLRIKRNEKIYEGESGFSETQVDEAIKNSEELARVTREWLKREFPGLVGI